MDRRQFLSRGATGALGAAGGTVLAAPALAQGVPSLSWRCASAFSPAFPTLHGGAVRLADLVREMSGGAFSIEVIAPEPGAPATAASEAVRAGRAELCHTATLYDTARNPAYALGASVPFALNARGLNAWLYAGGGIDLLNGFFAGEGFFYLPGGNTGAQMGGWYKREINAVQDLKGLKIRASGLAEPVLAKLGAAPRDLAPDAILPALQDGALDAAEWVGPAEDETLGLVKAAPFYYYPGWWEGSLALAFLAGKAQWEMLPTPYRSMLHAASRTVTMEMLAAFDFRNPKALRRLVEAGAQLRPFPQDVLNAAFDAAREVYREINGRNAAFRTLYDSMAAFRNETFLYQQVPEYTFDTFMMIKQREGALAVSNG